MNRNEFMKKLEEYLAGISKEEREEALQYYRDYFEDAGAEHEADVIMELGSPEKVAATIKADLKHDSGINHGAFTERGYEDVRFEQKESPAQRTANTYEHTGNTATGQNAENEQPRTSKGLKILLIALILIIGAPIVIPVGIGLALAVVGIVVGVFAFFAGLVLGAAAIMFAGAVIIIVGIPLLAVALPAGLLTIGSGLVTLVIGIIATVATVKLCIVMYPAMFRILVKICRWPFYRGKAVG